MLAAPSLGGESFGMVLTEAFAAGTPVVASDIAGYRDVVRDGVDGVLFPRGDAQQLAELLRGLAHDPARTAQLGAGAAASAERYAWPKVAAQVTEVYEDARAVPQPEGARRSSPCAPACARPAWSPHARARRMPSLEPPLPRGHRYGAALRRGVLGAAGIATVAGSYMALDRIGVDRIGRSLLDSSPTWVLVGLALMCLSMGFRAVSWHAILKAALPKMRPRFTDAWQGTTIGVLMSATLPARLGEPSRALIVSRRLGRPRESLPVVLGTLVSQTLLNVVALMILGVVMFSTVGLFAGQAAGAGLVRAAPVVLLALVLLAPALLRSGLPKRSTRVHRLLTQARAGRRARAPRARRLPPPAAGHGRRDHAARRVGAAVGRVLRAARRARARRPGRRPRRRRGRALRGERHRRAPRHAVQPRRLPGRLRGGAAPAPTGSAPPTRSATGSSSRPSRWRPP